MSKSFTVNLESLEALYELLIACAGEMLNSEFAVGPGKPSSTSEATILANGDVNDFINGAWGYFGNPGANLSQVFGAYEGSMQDAGKSVENIANALAAAIKHYREADDNVRKAATS